MSTLRLAAGAVVALALGAPGLTAQEPSGEPFGCSGEGRVVTGVTLADFGWMEGSWRGTGPEGSTAEIHYMAPAAGVLPSVFRLRTEERTVVLEALTLVEEERGVVLYVRHFTPALEPLEAERALVLRLVERRGDCFLFENLYDENPRRGLLRRTGDDSFLSRSELLRDDGTVDEIRVEYRRVRPPSPADSDRDTGG